MFIRLVIFLILGVLIYRAVKGWLGSSGHHSDQVSRQSPHEVDDVMIKDPVCGSYFPQRLGVTLDCGDKDLCFCSVECRDRYLAQHQEAK